MSDVGLMVAELIAAGCAPELAARVVTEAFVMGASVRNSAENCGNCGIPVDEKAEKRRAYDRERKRNSAEFHRNSTVSAEIPISHREKISKKDSMQDSKRGTRVDPAWTPSEADRQLAKQEGFSDSEIDREAMRFRDFWVGKAGAGGVKLDWTATWRNWVRNSADRLGKAQTSSIPTASDKLDWDAILQTYKKIGVWSKWAGPDLSSPACRAPRELLEKYGLLADGRTVN